MRFGLCAAAVWLCLIGQAEAQTFAATFSWTQDSGVNLTEYQASVDGGLYQPIVVSPAITQDPTPRDYQFVMAGLSAGPHTFAIRACNVNDDGVACSSSYTVAFTAGVDAGPPTAPSRPRVTVTVVLESPEP